MTTVQYSPHPAIVDDFRTYPFVYTIQGSEGIVLTTLNKVRKYLANTYGILDASRRLIQELLYEVGGSIIGTAVNSYAHRAYVCRFHAWAFSRRVEIALRRGEIRKDGPYQRATS